jgi:YVTN family beta-propeller protein
VKRTPQALARLALLALLATGACGGPVDAGGPWAPASLEPEPNPFGPGDPLWAPQPHRDRPRAAALSADGATLYVALQGAEDVPSDEVAVVDVATRAVRRRIRVGRAPAALALHPGGRWLVVANLLSNWASVIDTRRDAVVAEVPVPWYTTAVAFAPDGRRAYLANRWKDAIFTWSLAAGDDFAVVADDYRQLTPWQAAGTPTVQNPEQLLLAPDGATLYVSSVTAGAVDVFAAGDAGLVWRGRIAPRSPIGGMLLAGDRLVVSHIGRGTGFPTAAGVDGDQDGAPGDGTPNVMFQDLQNELEVFDTRTLASVYRATSDTICCFDYRDVDPDHPERGLAIPPPESWPPERAAELPPRSTWIVAGALPTRMARLASPAPGVTRFAVIMAASNQVQRFDLDETTGALAAADPPGALYDTGHQPVDLVARDGGAETYVVDRLGETVTVLATGAPPAPGAARDVVVVGDVRGGAFPATDVELGELLNTVTAPFNVDGDQSCVHCHREGGTLDRVVAMPLQTDRLWGSRQIQAYRGAHDTRPWFLEAAMDEKNFFPVLNELNRKENFCCEGIDTLVWSTYPSVSACLADPAAPGCNHVLHCADDPPPECATRGYGSPYLTRNAFFLAAARRVIGRDTTFGDSLRVEGTGAPMPLDFDGMTRAIGLFLLAAPRLPPNPNRALGLAQAARGREIYLRPEVGCAACHPLPVTTITIEPSFSPSGLPVRLPPVITPSLNPDGEICDTVTKGFRDTFSVAGIGATEQGPEGIHFGVPQLRGLWDRASRFFHDGRARTLRGALLPPGHPALAPGEPGFNERFGMIDTHGGTSQLTPAEVDDLVVFLLTL